MPDRKRLHIAELTGSGMATEFRTLAHPHMGSDPWVPEETHIRARLEWRNRQARLKGLLRRCHAAMGEDLPAGKFNQLMSDVERELGRA